MTSCRWSFSKGHSAQSIRILSAMLFWSLFENIAICRKRTERERTTKRNVKIYTLLYLMKWTFRIVWLSLATRGNIYSSRARNNTSGHSYLATKNVNYIRGNYQYMFRWVEMMYSLYIYLFTVVLFMLWELLPYQTYQKPIKFYTRVRKSIVNFLNLSLQKKKMKTMKKKTICAILRRLKWTRTNK